MILSLLRPGSDTRPGRFAKEVGPTGADLVGRVSAKIWGTEGERQREVMRATVEAQRAEREGRHGGMEVVSLWGEAYPPQLMQIADPPPVLWVHGHAARLRDPSVAVVGSRDATPASLAMARTLGRELADAGLVVVSGLARGVDAAAHAGALEVSGTTVAVLGSGLDVVYPKQHVRLASEIARSGAVVSELPPGALPLPRHFPLRNRIISGLSRAVVVVEASERSGSLITARMALDQGRDVLAVPGGPISGRHRGCHALIKDGARLVETVEDVLDEIRWGPSGAGLARLSDNLLPTSDLEATMAKGEPYTVQELTERTGRPAAEVLAELSVLELSGRLIRQGGGHFVRLPGRRVKTRED